MIGQIKGRVDRKEGEEKKEWKREDNGGGGRKAEQKHLAWRNCKLLGVIQMGKMVV
jgi:hypothetical protein